MAMDSESRKKLQIFLLAAIVIAGVRATYIVYDRYQARKEDAKPKQEKALKADYYITPKKLHPYDLKSARELTRQPIWVKVGYANTYYPYDVARRRAEFGREAGTLLPLQKLQIQDVVTDDLLKEIRRQILEHGHAFEAREVSLVDARGVQQSDIDGGGEAENIGLLMLYGVEDQVRFGNGDDDGIHAGGEARPDV